MKNDMEPCPFCNQYPVLLHDKKGYYFRCLWCGCVLGSRRWPTEMEAAKKWNHRCPVKDKQCNERQCVAASLLFEEE